MKHDPVWLLANWKMNGAVSTVAEYAAGLQAALHGAPEWLNAIFCPPGPYLITAATARGEGGRLAIGAQNCHAEPKGAFTGEISAAMVKETGCAYVILGHSERRQMGETDEAVYAKVQAALAASLVPVICVGESEAAYMAGETQAVLAQQLQRLKDLPPESYLIAYEPVWAIGTGKTPAPPEIEAVHGFIKSVLGRNAAVLYGGSVSSGNAREILSVPGVSGALIGSASLTLSVMKEIIADLNG